MTRALSGRVVAALAICSSILLGANARANALSDAWSCAKDTVKSGYYMATKGANLKRNVEEGRIVLVRCVADAV